MNRQSRLEEVHVNAREVLEFESPSGWASVWRNAKDLRELRKESPEVRAVRASAAPEKIREGIASFEDSSTVCEEPEHETGEEEFQSIAISTLLLQCVV